MKEYLALIGGIIGVLTNIPLIVGIWQNKVKQSFSTWILWAALDIVAAVNIVLKHGNYWLPLGYMFGSISVSFILLFKKQFSWSKIETFILILVLISIIVWITGGSYYAIIASTSGLAIASIPQIIETIKNPKGTPSGIYLLFCLANILSLLGAKNFNVEEILYSVSALVICFLVTILSFRK